MTFRTSQLRAMCSLGVLALPVAVFAQAPRYQSPLALPNQPQKQGVQLPTPQPITPNGVVVEDVIVRVNDQIINRSDLERSVRQMEQEDAQNHVSPEDAAERQKNMLRDMIDQQLLLSRAKEMGLNGDAEVIRRLDEIRKQNHLDSMEALEAAARQQNINFEDFKANIKNSILTQQVVREEVGRHLQMTQGQEQAYYNEHKQEYAQPEQIRLSEILVPTPADANEATVAQAKAKADDIESKLKAGDKFDDLAKTYSGGPTASQGGDLGQFKHGGLAKVIEDQTFPLEAGQNTAPIRTRQGFVILKVTEHQQAGVPPMKDIEPQIQEAMYMQQMQPALRAYLTKLREEAYIDIKPGFVDSGASPRQTKPVFSAYAPPTPKKKPQREKQRFERGHVTPASTTTTKPAAAAPGLAAVPAATSGTVAKASSRSGKPKKIKREKIRFGQAPRNALPPGPAESSEGAGAGIAASTQANDIAPGEAMAPSGTTTQVLASASDPDPLAPKPTSTGKTRFADRAKFMEEEKQTKKVAAVKQKAAFAAAAPTKAEATDEKSHSDALGLNGDTAAKKKKKREKGQPKERLQDKKVEKPAEVAAPAPTVNPNLGATPSGMTPTPIQTQKPADTTTPQTTPQQ